MKIIEASTFEEQIIEKKADGVFIISKAGCAPCQPFKEAVEAAGLNIDVVNITEKSGQPFSIIGKVTSYPAVIRVCAGQVVDVMHRPSVEDAHALVKFL